MVSDGPCLVSCLAEQRELAGGGMVDESEWALSAEEQALLEAVREKKTIMRQRSRLNKSKNAAVTPRGARSREINDVSGGATAPQAKHEARVLVYAAGLWGRIGPCARV
jgi:hypothetical protein